MDTKIIREILTDRASHMTVGEIKGKYNLSDEAAYAIMWCSEGLSNLEILHRLENVKFGMTSKEIERIMRNG